MAYNDEKILQVLLGELEEVPERCEGYRKKLGLLLDDVLKIEQEHAISRTNVIKKISDRVNTAGMFLYKVLDSSTVHEEMDR